MLYEHASVNRWLFLIWGMLLSLAMISAMLFSVSPVGFRLSAMAASVGCLLVCLAVAGFLLIRLNRLHLGLCLTAIVQLAVLATLGAMTSLPIASLTEGYADLALARADVAIGFNWRAYIDFVATRPMIRDLLKAGYFMFVPETFLLVAYTALRGRTIRVLIYITACVICIGTALIGFALAPAAGAFVHYGIEQDYIAKLNVGAFDQYAAIELARSGTMITGLEMLSGVIAIPSMHTAGALLLLWLGWSERWLRPVLLPLNVAMIAATPLDGAHYLVDVIAGALTVIIALPIAGRFGSWCTTGPELASHLEGAVTITARPANTTVC